MARGFVDLQVNGWRGTDFSAPGLTLEDCAEAARRVLNAGTAAFMPTVITSGMDVYENNLPVISQVIAMPEFRERILGIHLEGPFISAQNGARGAHPLEHVRQPDIDLLRQLIRLGRENVRMLTLAPELPGTAELIAEARKHGITVSLGHQLAESSTIKAAAVAGARAITHLGNGLPAMVNRHENPMLESLACDDLNAMIITDGHHLPDALIKIILRVKGADRVVITSDATALSDMPPGTYEMFGSQVKRDQSGKVYNPASGYLAGSGSSILECMNYLASLDLLGEADLIKVGFNNPLTLIGASSPPDIQPPTFDSSKKLFTL